MATHLPLFPAPPRATIEYARPSARKDTCTRCNLSEGAKVVCVGADGSDYKAPGGLLVLAGAPFKGDPHGSPFGTGRGSVVRHAILQALKGTGTSIIWDYAVRCPAPKGEAELASIEACRTYLAETLAVVRPRRILTFGDTAAQAIFGNDVPGTRLLRNAYGWLATKQPTPVFLHADPQEAVGILTMRKRYLAEVVNSLTAAPVQPPWKDTYCHVETQEDVTAALQKCRDAKITTLDVESNGAPLWTQELKITSLALTPKDSTLTYVWSEAALRGALWEPLAAFIEDVSAPKALANGKFDSNALRTVYGIELCGVAFDTMLVGRLVDVEADADLDTMGWYVGMGGHKSEAGEVIRKAAIAINKSRKKDAIAEARGQVGLFGPPQNINLVPANASAKGGAYGLLTQPILSRYNARDTATTDRLVTHLQEQLAGLPPVRGVWERLLRPATEVFARMESWGFPIDVPALYATADKIAERIEFHREAIRKAAPNVNPDSAEQIGKFLYEDLGLPVTVLTEGGAPSTKREALEELADKHPLADSVARYSELTHSRNTYLDGSPLPGQRYGKGGMLAHIRHRFDYPTVHTTYNLTGAQTGRLSSSSPNLQNIRRAEYDPTDPETIFGKYIKDLFTAPPGFVWVQMDFANLELRCCALLCGDPEMAKVFASGVDYHLRTAELVALPAWGISPEKWVSMTVKERKPYRSMAKTCIAEGQLVLTNRGSVPIQDVLVDDLVWDGVEWVSHEGVIYKGYREVMTYDGLTATPDHEVYLQGGSSAPFGEAARRLGGRSLAVGGDGQVPVGYASDDGEGGAGVPGETWAGQICREAHRVCVFCVSEYLPYLPIQRAEGQDYVLSLSAQCEVRERSSCDSTREASIGHDSEVQHSDLPGVPPLRWARDRVQVQVQGALHPVGVGVSTSRNIQGRRYRQEGQRRALRAGEPTFGVAASELDKQAHNPVGDISRERGGYESCMAPHQDRQPRLSVGCREDLCSSTLGRARGGFAGSGRYASPHRWQATQPVRGTEPGGCCHLQGAEYSSPHFAHVYDLVNAGPRHRFVVSNRVVANCNFALLFGQGNKATAHKLKITEAEATKIANAIFGHFHVLKRWDEANLRQADQSGVLWTIWRGDKARMRPVHHTDYKGTVSTNTIVQGSANDYCLASAIACDNWLRKDRVPARLAGTVHDSLLFLVKEHDVDEVVNGARAIMEGWTRPGEIRMTVDAEVGERLGSLEPYAT